MNVALILASGTGSRMGAEKPKQFLEFRGKTILEHTIEVFHAHAQINSIVVVMHPDHMDTFAAIAAKNNYSKLYSTVAGGEARSDSGLNGLLACPKGTRHVLIHDAARPFVSQEIITRCIAALEHSKAVCVAIPATDTIAIVDENKHIIDVPNRNAVYHNQTPQAFAYDLILDAHKKVKAEGVAVTDDVSVIRHVGTANVGIVEGDELNIKITYPADLDRI